MEDKKIKKIMLDLQKKLSTKRFNHSIGVMRKAIQLANIYKQDELQAAKVGLAHDIAKEMSKEEILNYVNENNIKADETELQNLGLLHGKIGADICKKRYNFTDDMCMAIINHTTGDVSMSFFDKIIFVADKIEEGRKWDGVEEIRIIADKDIDLAIIKLIDRSIQKCIKKNEIIHINSIHLRNKLIQKKDSNNL